MTSPIVAVTPAAGRHVYEGVVDGNRVLFNSADRRLHVLNPSAAAVWERLATPTTVSTLVADLAAAFDVDRASIRLDVERTLDHFVADGLTDDAPAGIRPPDPTVRRPRDRAVATLTALDATVDLLIADDDIARSLEPVIAPLRAPAGSVGQGWIKLDDDGGAWTLTSSLGTVARTGSRLAGLLRVISEVNAIAIASVDGHLVFHAGAVARNGRAVVLPGSSNRGKSTLTTALVAAGFSYLSDEAAAIDPDGVVMPFPKSIALDPGSFGLFPDLAPQDDTPLAGLMRRREWHVDPGSLGVVAGPTPVTAIVCPSWRAGASTRLARVRGADAVHTLLGDAFDFRRGGRRVFEILMQVAAEVPVYRLGYGDLDDAVAAVGRVLDGAVDDR